MNTQNNSVGRESPQDLSRRLNQPFKDLLLLTRALTHRSYFNEHPEALEDNERLEFLGDAVLDFLVGAWLYNRYPEMAEGGLTRMRSSLVHTDRLAKFAKKVHLENAIRLGRGESNLDGRERSALLCDAFEALIGAIYLDAGIEAVNKFISPFLEEATEEIILNDQVEDPKSLFQEWAQARGYTTPQYITRSATGPDHMKVFEVEAVVNGEVYGSGMGPNKLSAAKAAALDALTRVGLWK